MTTILAIAGSLRAKSFNAQGKLTDSGVRAQVEKYMATFAQFVTRQAR